MRVIKPIAVTGLLMALAGLAALASGYDISGLFKPATSTRSAAPESPGPTVAVPTPEAFASTGGKVEVCEFCGKACHECPPPPPDREIEVKLRLAGAQFNDAPHAELSHLDFELDARWPGFDGDRLLHVDSPKGVPTQKLELGLCRVEIQPIFSAPVQTAGREQTAKEWTTRGGYLVTFRDDAGKLMDQAVIGPMPGGNPAEGSDYTVTLNPNRGKWSDLRTDIFEGKINHFAGRNPLFSYEVLESGYDSQRVNDPAGNRFTYIFPRARVVVYPLAVLKDARAERLAARKVKYGWWGSPSQPAGSRGTANAGTGGGGMPSGGCSG